MISPARASLHRKLASQAAPRGNARGAAPMPQEGPVASEYQLLLAALGVDLIQLRNIQSIERKIEAKREMIDRYLPWIDGALSAENGAQDEIVSTMMVWSIDVGDWDLALRLAEHVLKHGIALPERYKRQPAVLVAEEFAEAGLKPEPAIDLPWLMRAQLLTAGFDMPDQVRAKLAKAIGLAFLARAATFDPEAESAMAGGKPALIEAALTQFRRALELDQGCGVKKLIERQEAALKKLAPDPAN
ncbi:phage terminase small subunit [Novosphingobium sp.]|uniref:phage terminase small subunit n=1 Tax=Novosphingobium sp. TaxID=1874826 RepID=UPI001EC12AD5|nr:phage terminase small subunit [Novosphingobium sp.]MBK6801637.1 terminase [Novosphingobium sp.]MBK9009995.1 terminase [Novosphingobium sp.]